MLKLELISEEATRFFKENTELCSLNTILLRFMAIPLYPNIFANLHVIG